MNSIKTFFFVFILLALMSCGVTKNYEKAKQSDTIGAYEDYLDAYPKSKYREEIQKQLEYLYEERSWRTAIYKNTVEYYKSFIERYPKSKYVSIANKNINVLREENAWNSAIEENTINAYKSYLIIFPNGKYLLQAKSKLLELQDKYDWHISESDDSIEKYKEYLEKHPYGKYRTEVENRIEELEEIIPEWEKTCFLNNLDSYNSFILNYPDCKFTKDAENRIFAIENSVWNNAVNENSKKSYDNYLNLFPVGKYSKTANKKIIDFEVDEIMSEDHGKLPVMEPVSSAFKKLTYNEIEIENSTGYTLTVRYSGPESKKIIIQPNETSVITLSNGTYRVTATVNAYDVNNYAGNEILEGEAYSVEYYIKTEEY